MIAAPAFQIERSTRTSRVAGVIALVVLIGLVALPYWGGRADMRLAIEIFYFLALAQMWNLLAGYAGLVSIGQQAFVGLGGYMLFVFSVFLGVNPLMSILIAGVVCAAAAAPTAFVVFRLQGAYFAIGTWVMAEVFRLIFAQISALGGGSGMSLPTAVVKSISADRAFRESLVYWIALAIAVVAVALVYFLLRSRHGLALTAIRDSEVASESLGVNNLATKFWVYLVAAFMTGIVGGLIYLQKLRIAPDAGFNVIDWTANVLMIVIIGGIGTIEGPIIGVIIFFVLREFLSDLGSWYMIILGLLAVVIMLRAPQGVWGFFAARYNIYLFPVSRRLRVTPGEGPA